MSYLFVDHAYSEGPLRVISLLFSALDGLDPNDPKKCYKSITLITAFAQLIPIVECKKSKVPKTPEEQKLCETTSRFRDFVLQFMDKIFELLVSGALEFNKYEAGGEHYGTSPEAITEKTIEEAFDSLLMQTNESVFKYVLKKLSTFIMEKNSELSNAGNRLVATMCYVYRKNDSEVALRAFLPYFAGSIENAIGTSKEVLEADHLEVNLIFSLELCKRLVESARGDHLLPYIIAVTYMLKKATWLKNSQGNELACGILKNVLESLITVQPICLNQNMNDVKYPYWKDWGESVNGQEAKIKWFFPSVNGMNEAEKFFNYFFVNATKFIQDHANEKRLMHRFVLSPLIIRIFIYTKFL